MGGLQVVVVDHRPTSADLAHEARGSVAGLGACHVSTLGLENPDAGIRLLALFWP